MNQVTCVPLKLSQSCECPCSVRILSSRSP
jgi:hypothetical protein